MSDSLEKFVLQYDVKVDRSIEILEKLQERMDAVNKTQDKTSKGLSSFADNFRGISSEFDRAASVVDKFGGRLAKVGIPLTAVGAAVMFARKELQRYNEQLSMSYATGMSLPQLENARRTLIAGSGGQLSREDVDRQLPAIGSLIRAARIDPFGGDAIKLRMLGISSMSSPADALGQLSQHWAGMSQTEAEGQAQAVGLTPQLADGIRQLGSAEAQASAMTIQQQAALVDWQANMKVMSGVLGDVNSETKSFTQNSANELIDFFGKIGSGIATLGDKISRSKIWDWLKRSGEIQADADGAIVGPGTDARKRADAADAAAKAAAQKKVDEANKGPEQIFDASAMFARAAALFQQSVNSYTNTVDLQQAAADAAGESAGGAGLGGGSASPRYAEGGGNTFTPASGSGGASLGITNNNPGNLKDGKWAQSQPGYKGANGGFAVFDTMASGVAAHEALLDSNYYGKGLNTPREIIAKYAPSSDPGNNTQAYLDFLKSKGFDPDKAITDKAGFNAAQLAFESHYNPETIGAGQNNPVANANGNVSLATGGYNRTRLLAVANELAANMHVSGATGAEIMRGVFTRGDVQLGYQRAYSSAVKDFINADGAASTPGMNSFQIQQANANLRTAALHVRNLEAYSSQVLGMARAGGQSSQTLGQTAQLGDTNISVSIQAAGWDEKRLADEIHRVIGGILADAHNQIRTTDKL